MVRISIPVVAAVGLAMLATGTISAGRETLGSTASFWIGLVPHSLGLTSQGGPPSYSAYNISKPAPIYSGVPTVATSLRPHIYRHGVDVEVAGGLCRPPSRRARPRAKQQGLFRRHHAAHGRLRDVYKSNSVDVFTHMTNDISSKPMPFDEYLDRMGDTSMHLYARAVPDTVWCGLKRTGPGLDC